MSIHYPPLAFLNQMKTEGSILYYDEIASQFKISFHSDFFRDTDEKDFYLYALSQDIINPGYKGKFQALNRFLIDKTPLLAQTSNFSIKDLQTGKIDMQSEWRDQLLFPLLLGQWEKNKQVYLLDPDFAKALSDSDNLVLSRDDIEHLPCNSFYIDLTGLKDIYPILGTYVFVNHTFETAYVSSYVIMTTPSGKMFFYSSYMHADYKEDGTILLDMSIISGKRAGFLTWEDNRDAEIKIDVPMDREALAALPIQLITYMTSAEPDIEESPVTKNTYKKPSSNVVPKNTFKEVQIWDTGIRFGTSFRSKLKEYAESVKTNTLSDKKRKPPVPHYRRAHWQRFWVGPHDSEERHQENRWIPPIFVGGTEAKDVTIHKIK